MGGAPKGGLMSKSGLYQAAPIGEGDPLHINPEWCPSAGTFRQAGSLVGPCNHPVSQSSQNFLCHLIS